MPVCLFLILTGGEPFLYPNSLQLYEELALLGLIISINTNGALIDEDTVAVLKRCVPKPLQEAPSNETREEEPAPRKIKSAFRSLSSDISINFYVADERLAGWNVPNMMFTKAKYDAEGNITGYVTATVSSYAEKDGCHVYTFRGITSTEISSAVTATQYAAKNMVDLLNYGAAA